MDLQMALTTGLILLSFVYCAWKGWSALRVIRAGGCGGSCGCESQQQKAKQPGLVQVDDLTARLRQRRMS